MAAPDNASLIGVISPLPIEAIAYTKTAVTPAPVKASQMYCCGRLILKKAIPHTTNNEAPVFTPKILGSAMGFLVMDCIRAPDTPSAPPAIIPKTILGILACTTLTVNASPLAPVSAESTSLTGMYREPVASESIPHSIVNSILNRIILLILKFLISPFLLPHLIKKHTPQLLQGWIILMVCRMPPMEH
ncbi:hypothetical protein SAMN05216529_10646 [Faecalicatena contorta]|uniref:Uncharacterized protein n=1 Tax=Faecalicatena contorta TaxID=39482 RepID=A0A315ZVJ9_9FIRM|nr:hypothetical protein A8805_10646 [Faecalicatena contorta]SUQ14354.1 hypothetical protein SAMN05216529_10646 [Faecalicatena contorta]